MTFEQKVRRILTDVGDIVVARNKEYGNSALDPVRVFSKSDRMEQLKVREIRRRYASGEGPTSIGRDFGLTATTVIDISKFKTWKHVGESE